MFGLPLLNCHLIGIPSGNVLQSATWKEHNVTKWAIGPSGYANNVGHYQRVPGTVISQRLMTPEDADSPYNLIIPPLYATLW